MKHTKETILKIPDLKAGGLSDKETADKLGMKLSTLRYWKARLRAEGHEVPELAKIEGRPKIDLTK